MEMTNLEVNIIGGGLVGSLTACLLAKRGYKVELYEYRSDIRKTLASRGRTINLSISERGRRALEVAELDKVVLKNALPLRGRMLHLPNGELKTTSYDPHKNQCIYTVDRKLLNEILLNEKYTNVKLHFQHKLIDISLESGLLTFLRTNDDTKVEIHSNLTIGADGAFSAVRREMMKKARFDFEQYYIAHGYVELAIPPAADGNFAMREGYLHLWPRGQYVMVAMPNQDRSWTVTLFLPFTTFDSLDCSDRLLGFFNDHFEDAIQLIGEQRLIADFFKSKPSPLVSIKCHPYHVSDRVVLIGDSAHAMLPFYGQGMNAGFEDCVLLSELLATLPTNKALKAYTDMRWSDAHAICDLAMYNFSEISSLVTHPSWTLKRWLDTNLHNILGNRWQPLYQAVCFTAIPYDECRKQQKWQDQVIQTFILSVKSLSIIIFFWIILYYYY